MPQNQFPFLHSLFKEHEDSKRKIFHSFKAKADLRRTFAEKLSDRMTSTFGSMTFLVINVLVFLFWILINTGQIKLIPIFDPFPFNFLTTFVSIEAIVLAVFVLISQNRSMKISDLREETHLQIDLISEKEVTKIMKMLVLLLEKNGFDLSEDSELKRLLKPLSEAEIEKMLEKEIS